MFENVFELGLRYLCHNSGCYLSSFDSYHTNVKKAEHFLSMMNDEGAVVNCCYQFNLSECLFSVL